jgi:glycosyltransferase involved in cell wall biosynthesis
VSPSGAPVTVVIAARDESANIKECVASAAWAAEVLVAESGSKDDTVQQAQRAGARVLRIDASSIAAQRNMAITEASNDWIFVLDADERVPDSAAREITALVSGSSRFDAYRVHRRNHFLGREIRHGGWERDRPVRLFRKRLRYAERAVHEHVVTDGPVGTMSEPIVHYPYRSLAQWFEKLDRYSHWWAEDNHARGRRAAAWQVITHPPAKFFTAYVLRAGWRDGAHGAVLAALGAASVLAKYARLWELSLRPGFRNNAGPGARAE